MAYDANGNLIQKGDLHLEYDFRNMLVRVSDPNGEIARYEYDAFNRRTARHVGGQAHETVWAGLREIEELVDGQLASRSIFGLGLDEIVRVERDADGDGGIDQELVPLYDHTGNLAVMTDAEGRPLERYAYTPYGERTVTVDLTPPRVVQVRVVDGSVWVEASEEVRLDALVAAAGDGGVGLTETGSGDVIAVNVTQPVETGQLKRRRFVLTPAVAPAEGTEVALRVDPEALIDLFLNGASEPLEETFEWPAGELLVLDEAPPELVQVAVKDGSLEVQFSEEVNPASLSTGLRLDGQPVAWTGASDGYTLLADEAIEEGAHTLAVTSSVVDLAGTALPSGRNLAFTVPATSPNVLVFRTPDPREIGGTTVGNRAGFHGRPVDPETGFVYVRNRYLDSDVGRFITADPLGHIDGPSLYAAFGNNPVNFGDPLGLYIVVNGTDEIRIIKRTLENVGLGHLASQLRLLGVPKPEHFKHNRKAAEFDLRIVFTGPESEWLNVESRDEAIRQDPIAQGMQQAVAALFYEAITSPYRISFDLTDDDLSRGQGAITSGQNKFGADTIDHQHPERSLITIMMNPEQVSRAMVPGDLDTRVPVPLEAAVIHELAHAYWYFARGGTPRLAQLNPQATNGLAVSYENKYRYLRRCFGELLPPRLRH